MDGTRETFIQKINRKLPQNKDKLKMIETLIGISGCFCNYICSNTKINELPTNIKYAIAVTSANILSFISDQENIDIVDCNENKDHEMSEQTQEIIYRQTKNIIFEMYQILKEEEKI